MKFTLSLINTALSLINTASIKAGERVRRGSLNTSLEIKIHGPSNPVPKQWGKYLPNLQNKTNLCKSIRVVLYLRDDSSSLLRKIFSLLEDLRMADGQ